MRVERVGLAKRVGEIVSAAGIDNFHIEDDVLVMCGVRYALELCSCSDPGCNGIRLLREGDRGAHWTPALQ